jgi:iron complex transport system substrate-binding protein
MITKRIVRLYGVVLFVGWVVSAKGIDLYEIEDMAGRTVSIPKDPTRLYPANPPATELLYTLCRDYMVGKTFSVSKEARPFLDPAFLELPVLGGWMAGGLEGNCEEIILQHPEVVIYATFQPDQARSYADRIQKQLNIPVVVVDIRLESLADAYRFIGPILHKESRAQLLGAYAAETMAEIQRRAACVVPSRRVRVYYAESANGFQTDPSGSIHSRLIDLIGGENVAQVKLLGGKGRSTISPEQILVWNPELILVCPDQNNFERIRSDVRLKPVQAIQTGAIYKIPHIPYNIFDRPPSISRLLGLRWTGCTIYPDLYSYDLFAEFRRFYQLFYEIELTDEQIAAILVDALRL